MTLEENKAIVRRLFDVIQRGDYAAFDELMAPDFANHALGRVQIGLEPWAAIFRTIRATIPDETTTIDDLIAEGDKVVVRATLKGTHQGSALPMFAGIKPGGKPIEWQFIHIYRLRDGKIVEHWAQRNDLEVRQQLQ
jgi:predicted ester cyclase